MARPARPRPTLTEVSERAGVSTATVSRVLNGTATVSPQTRRQVMDAVRTLRYRPLRRRQRTAPDRETHGLVVPTLHGGYYAELVAGYQQSSGRLEHSLTALSAEGAGDLTDRVRALAARVDGLVIAHVDLDPALLDDLVLTMPVVTIGVAPHQECDSVSTENTEPATALVHHLVGHGRRRLRFVGDPSLSRDVERRYAGYLQGLSECELSDPLGPLRTSYIDIDAASIVRDLFETGAEDQADALVCVNDEVAIGVIEALRAVGVRVPDDIAVTGWDGLPAGGHMSPPLTTVVQEVRDLARQVARRLHERIQLGLPAGPPVEVPCAVRVGGTCGCPA